MGCECWQRRSKWEKALIIILPILIILIAAGVGVFVALKMGLFGGGNVTTAAAAKTTAAKARRDLSEMFDCKSKSCNESAYILRKNIDEGYSPCENFYQFACSGWKKEHPIPRNEPVISIYTEAELRMFSEIREKLKRPLSAFRADHIKELKKFYESCMNSAAIKEIGLKPLSDRLNKLGGWPIIKGSDWKEIGWVDLMTKVKEMGFAHNILLDLKLKVDYENNKRYVAVIDHPSLFLFEPSAYLTEDKYIVERNDYKKYMLMTAVTFGAPNTPKTLKMVEAIIEFEKSLAKAFGTETEIENAERLYNESEHKILYKKVQESLKLYFTGVIREDEKVVFADPSYVRRFIAFMNDSGTAKPDVIANYIIWRVVASSLPFLKSPLVPTELYMYLDKMQKIGHKSNNWKECLSITKNSLDVAFSSFYLRISNFEQNTTAQIKKMFHAIQNQLASYVVTTEWMMRKTKTEALKRIEKIKLLFSFGSWFKNTTVLDKYHKDLNLKQDTYFENILKVRKWKADKLFSKIGKSSKADKWLRYASAATSVQASYDYRRNDIVMPGGIMQPPFFKLHRQNYLNFGAIGSIISRELFHAIIENGQHIGGKKNIHKNMWWDENTKQNFEEKISCIIEQYNKYIYPNRMQLSDFEKSTRDDMIAEAIGLKESYEAYNTWQDRNPAEPRLLGLFYAPQQLFWINYAQTLCFNIRHDYEVDLIKNYGYIPPDLKLQGVVSSLSEFADDFFCYDSTPELNRISEKCTV